MHERYTSLKNKYSAMKDDQTQKENDLRGMIEYQTTTTQSLVREIEELKSIHFTQCQRAEIDEAIQGEKHVQSEQDYMSYTSQKEEYQRRCDQTLSLGREFEQRKQEFEQIEIERQEALQSREREQDRVAKGEQDNQEAKKKLQEKRDEVELLT